MLTVTNLQVTTQGTPAIIEVGSSFSEDLVADWLAFNADKAEATVKTYSRAIGNFLSWLADNGIKNPCREDVIKYRAELCSSKKISTARLYTTAVKVSANGSRRKVCILTSQQASDGSGASILFVCVNCRKVIGFSEFFILKTVS